LSEILDIQTLKQKNNKNRHVISLENYTTMSILLAFKTNCCQVFDKNRPTPLALSIFFSTLHKQQQRITFTQSNCDTVIQRNAKKHKQKTHV